MPDSEEQPTEPLASQTSGPPSTPSFTSQEKASETEKQLPEEEELLFVAKQPEQPTPLSSFTPDREEPSPTSSLFGEESSVEPLLAEVDFGLDDETSRWMLKVVAGPNSGAEFPMEGGSRYLLGTDPVRCDLVFNDTSVSRQHARLTIGSDDALFLEDLGSRNGTLVDGKPLEEGGLHLAPHMLVTIGTTSFVVIDREGEMQTVISPVLPQIVKALQSKEEERLLQEQEEKKAAEEAKAERKLKEESLQKRQEEAATERHEEKKRRSAFGAFLLVALLTALLSLVGFATYKLFEDRPVELAENFNATDELQSAMKPFPSIRYSFTPATGRLLLVGHLLTASDKNRLLYSLQGLDFIKNVDDRGLIIDEYVAREINPLLVRNPDWRGVTLQTPQAGEFLLSGYLQTREQADRLADYISANFPFLDLLQKRVIIEEEVINSAEIMLKRAGLHDVKVRMDGGEVTLTGGLPSGKEPEFNQIMDELKKIAGVHKVKSFVSELPPEARLVNISDRYTVSGVSNQGGINVSVVINGRILTRGDLLDGMVITSIKPNSIFLEKDGVRYRIDY